MATTDGEGPSGVVRTAALLGGAAVFRKPINTMLDAHEMLVEGMPARALDHLQSELILLPRDETIEKAVGVSRRTIQRRREVPDKALSPDQGGRAWRFAEILGRADTVFGARADAERWLITPALALDGRRPIDLLASPAGADLVEDLLVRLEYGVYA